MATTKLRRYSSAPMAAIRTAKLPVGLIKTNAGTQSRASIDEQVVADYAEAMLNGAKFPPTTTNGELIFHILSAPA